MKLTSAGRAALAIIIAVISVVAVEAQDFTGWRGAAHDGVVTGFTAPARWPDSLKTRWKVTVGAGHSTPLVVGERVFIHARPGENEAVYALDLRTGKTLWRDSYPVAYTMNPAARDHGKGPKSTPAYSNGRLYTFGITGILSCYDASKGKLLWRKPFEDKFKAKAPLFGTATSPIVDRGMVIVFAGGNDQGGMVALDAVTGAEKWVWTGDGPGYATPIVVEIAGKRTIVTQSQKLIVGIHADSGGLLWKIPFTTDYIQNIVTPVAYKDLLIFSGINKGVFAVRVGWRDNRWVTDQVWETKEVSMYMNSPVIKDNLLFGMSHRNKGQFFCLDAATGKVLWTGDPRQGENAAMLIAGDKVFSLTNDGDLIITGVADKGAAVIRKYHVAESPAWAHPVLTGKSVLIKDENTLALLGME